MYKIYYMDLFVNTVYNMLNKAVPYLYIGQRRTRQNS